MKLSTNQQTALKRLREEYEADSRNWFSASEINQSMATLGALSKQGLIERKPVSSSAALTMPRFGVLFRYVPVYKAVVKFRCIGSSCDGRTGRWEVDCPDCGRKVKPATTLFAHQTFACDCGVKFEADWNTPSVKVMK